MEINNSDTFFKNKILKRESFFQNDINKHKDFLTNKILNSSILVIGGAGTIGSNYIKQILHFKPQRVVVVDTNENGLTELTRDLRSTYLLDDIDDFRTYPINLNDIVFDRLFNSESKFDVVANFAAHKHVRSEKDIYSIEALIRNNVFGAVKLIKLLKNNKPKLFFSVSTDKAANSVNIMGASKSLMEKILLSEMNSLNIKTARFANVAFSNGSLLDGFIKRINKRQPVSCPKDIKRFFVTPEESGQICMLATYLGDSGNIFFPKFNFENDQIFFKHIALEFFNYLGYNLYECKSEIEAKKFDFHNNKNKYPIFFFQSDTSGEKEYEEFYTKRESVDLKTFDSLGFIKKNHNNINLDKVRLDFEELFNKESISKSDIVDLIKSYVPDFNHIEKGKNLDDKM
tara:strand:- start:5296 stop:6498 length:1203 start_codon:yes stop_codon:yes gene_type:complete